MTEKKYQVFISSTFADLIDERRKILDILLMADCIPAGMEAFVATDDEQFTVIKKVIDLCDYYVLIIGKRYGSVNPSTGISYTEMEYEYAKEKEIPVLVFAIDDSVILPEEKKENDPNKIEKLKLFREKAMTNRLASIWKASDELTGKLAISIMRAKTEIIRPGWQRAVDYDEASLRKEIMEYQKEIKILESKLQDSDKVIASFTEQSDVAFDDCDIKLDYHYSEFYNRRMERRNSSKTVSLHELFKVIATQMMDVMITEDTISTTITRQLTNSHDLNDIQLVKRILNQLKVLGLVYSNWNEAKSSLYWGLTKKGEKVRDDMTLIRGKKVDKAGEKI
jgi:hypothetical protein